MPHTYALSCSLTRGIETETGTGTETGTIQILVHLGLSQVSGIRRLIEDVITFHSRQNIVLTSQEITSFYGQRPDGVAFDAKNKHCVFLEFTRPMDSVTSSDEGDWAETKELEKNERYRMHIYFSIILAPSMADLGTAQKPTSQLEQAAP